MTLPKGGFSRRAAMGQFMSTVAISSIALASQAKPKISQVKSTRPKQSAVDYLVPLKLSPAATLINPSDIHMDGWLGARIAANAHGRLMHADLEPLLSGFEQKPGSHPWIGEHIGKWIHAASLAWANTKDPYLKARLDSAVNRLIKAQEADGYLGTYLPDKRFGLYEEADWDVWSHKYCLMGLLTYYHYSGNQSALIASMKAADLLLATFPAKKSILKAGTHRGSSATSVIEPMVMLYRFTGDQRYLDFCNYAVAAMDEEGGPHILKNLLEERKVRKTMSAKAYEMLANIVGMCALARVTGDKRLIEAGIIAWEDVVKSQLFISGTASRWEYFQVDDDRRDDQASHVGETCVTTTWIQLSQILYETTGEARFGHELERTYYNALSAAQQPQGEDWCYFTPLTGRKHFDKHITCCHSSGPRGMALSPLSAYLKGHSASHDVLIVSTFETSKARMDLGGQTVSIEQQSSFPRLGQSRLILRLKQPTQFAIKVRINDWAQPVAIKDAVMNDGFAVIAPRLWKDGDTIDMGYSMGAGLETGKGYNQGRAAMLWGPFVLAFEQNQNASFPRSHLVGYANKASLLTKDDTQPMQFTVKATATTLNGTQDARLTTFADAGQDGGFYRVWLRAPDQKGPALMDSVLFDGQESRSRRGHIHGSINDEDFETLVSTYDGTHSDADWFAISLNKPVKAKRFVYYHGRNYHHGGWFDTSEQKPKVQIKRTPNAEWETIGELAKYPPTTAYDAGILKMPWMGSDFSLELESAIAFQSVRVIGKPSSGDEPQQSFVTCAQLQAFVV